MKAVSLFCGCGGFTSGARLAGLSVPVAYDIDRTLTWSFARNFPESTLKIGDISELSGSAVLDALGGPVDGVFGGPPCQGFSTIGRRDTTDPRRLLVGHFFRLVKEINPAFFVMENVVGLLQGEARSVYEDCIETVSGDFDVLPLVLDASEFGGATRRKRLFSIGIDTRKCDSFLRQSLDCQKKPAANVGDAIRDLSNPKFVTHDDQGIDYWRISYEGRVSSYAELLRLDNLTFTGNRRTVHTKAVAERFNNVPAGGIDSVGRHPRLDWASTCPTLRAGTGSDKGSYQAVRPIHPSEPRVITVREAARLQGFRDSHVFHPTIWHSFRMIGNSVSPFVANAIFRTLASLCGSSSSGGAVNRNMA